MKKGGRLASYRHGDRAEDLGVVLLQSFCAVANVPRQEDWGVFDAIATVLRQEGKLLFAESSFLIQFKSSGGKKFSFTGAKLDSLRSQDLPLFVASVNLAAASIELYPIAPALDDGGYDPATFIFHIEKQEKYYISSDVFNVYIGPPALSWNLSDTSSPEFQGNTSRLLLIWLNILKNYVQRTKLGSFDKIIWSVNKAPDVARYVNRSHTRDEHEAIQISANSMEWLMIQAFSNDSLVMPVIQIVDWFAERGMQIDDTLLRHRLMQIQMETIISEAMKKHSDACAAHALLLIPSEGDTISFWVGNPNRMKRFIGNADELAAMGFKIITNESDNSATLIDVASPWIDESKVKFLRMDGSAILYHEII